MATTKLILVTKSPKKDGTFPLKIQIGHKTKSTFIPTGIYLLENQFNGTEIITLFTQNIRIKCVSSEPICQYIRAYT